MALCEKTGEKSGGLDASQRVISDGWEAQPQSHGTPATTMQNSMVQNQNNQNATTLALRNRIKEWKTSQTVNHCPNARCSCPKSVYNRVPENQLVYHDLASSNYVSHENGHVDPCCGINHSELTYVRGLWGQQRPPARLWEHTRTCCLGHHNHGWGDGMMSPICPVSISSSFSMHFLGWNLWC